MIKKLAFALSMATICANVHPVYAFSNNEMLDAECRSRMMVKKMARVKRVQEANKIRLAKKRIRIEKIEERKKSRLAKRIVAQKAKKGSAVAVVENKQERFNGLITRATLKRRSKLTTRRSAIAPQKVESVHMIQLQEPVKNIVLSHVVVPELVVKEPLVVAAPSPTLASQPVSSLVEPQAPTISNEEEGSSLFQQAFSASRKAQHDEPAEKVNESSASVQSFAQIQDLLDVPIEIIRTRLESVENSINQVKEIVQNATNVMTDNMRFVVQEEFARVIPVYESSPARLVVDESDIGEEQVQFVNHHVDFDEEKATMLDIQITNLGMKLHQLQEGLAKVYRKTDYINSAYSLAAGKYLPLLSNEQKGEVERLLEAVEALKKDLSSLESELQAGDVYNPQLLIRPREAAERLKIEFNALIYSLGEIQSWSDILALQTSTTPKTTAQSGGALTSTTQGTTQPSALENAEHTIYYQGRALSYSLKAPELDKSKKGGQLFNSALMPTSAQPQENEITTSSLSTSSTIPALVASQLRDSISETSDLLNVLIDKSESIDSRSKQWVLNASANARAALSGEPLDKASPKANLKEEVIALKSTMQAYESLPQETANTRNHSAIQRWLSFIQTWAEVFKRKS